MPYLFIPNHLCRRTVVELFYPCLGNKGVHTFLKCRSAKLNVIARLGFELAYSMLQSST